MKHTVGGYALETRSTSVPSRLFGQYPMPGNQVKRASPNNDQNGAVVSLISSPRPTATIDHHIALDARANVPSA